MELRRQGMKAEPVYINKIDDNCEKNRQNFGIGFDSKVIYEIILFLHLLFARKKNGC